MDLLSLTIIFIFALGASFTQRVTGFGFGIFIMTILPHIMPSYGEATALSGLLALVGITITGIRMYNHLIWKNLWPILLTFIAVSFFAVKIVGSVDGAVLKHILGGILVVISIYFFFISGKIRLNPDIPVQIGMGTISGIMGGLFAMQGPPAVIYFLSCSKTKEEYAAITAFYFIIGNAVMTIFRATQGFVTASVGLAWLIGVPAVLLGLWIGGKVFDKLPVDTLRKVIYAFMAVAGVISLCSCTPHSKYDFKGTVSADSLRYTVEYLSSDSCEGRLPFTSGAERATDFIASRMLSCGLHSINGGSTTDDFMQDVPLVKIVTTVNGPMTIDGEVLEYRKDFTAFNNLEGRTEIDAELVFAGYGIVAPEYGKNDYAGIEHPENKVAIVIVNDPGLGTEGPYFNGNAMTYYGRWTYKFEEGLRQGLKGVLVVHDDLGAGYPWSTVTAGAHINYGLDDESRGQGLGLEGWLSAGAARRVLSASFDDVNSLFAAAREPSFKPIPLNSRVKVSLSNEFTSDSSPNIVGYIPGKTDECIVCTAHWDHLGVKPVAVEGDSICNGATDNATAVAWLLETARVLTARGYRPERSIVFLSPTTEELGMWGSEYYVTHPLVPMQKTVAVINKDVLTLWGECSDVTVTGYGYSDMDSVLAGVAEKYGCHIMPDPDAHNGMFYRSDHLPFMRRGVPAIFAKSWSESCAYGADWSSRKIKEYWSSIYHTVNDETTPEDDYSGLVKETEMFLDFIVTLADSDYTPRWNPSSEFQR